MVRRAAFFAFALSTAMLAYVGCGGDDSATVGDNDSGAGGDSTIGDDSGGFDSSGGGDTGGGDGNTTDGSGGDSGACRMNGIACTSSGQCCTANCDAKTGMCANPIGVCKVAGNSCATPNECCSFSCVGGQCSGVQCTSDNQACTTDAQCCGGKCSSATDGGAKTCTPLNGSCKTAGNTCSGNSQCCSAFCENGICNNQPSFCTQEGDTCTTNFECCGGVCNKATGATLGTCALPSAPGATQCTISGQLCGGGADGGPNSDGGLPSCGGDCCSRECAPYGPTGAFVCQPPSGCRPTGEVCKDDSDCCGYDGVQNVTGVGHCSKAGDAGTGRCDNGNACRPAGAICKLAVGQCVSNTENNCCSGNVNQNPLVCTRDILGIPRCAMVDGGAVYGCQDAGVGADGGGFVGQACGTSVDCCGLPCVPNPAFPPGAAPGSTTIPPFICGAACVQTSGSCTTNADCCAGLPCAFAPGSSVGTCGAVFEPDGGLTFPDSGPTGGDSGSTGNDSGTPPVCALYGQQCSQASDCCNAVPCTSGTCHYPIF